jgi:hypothetical protein
MSVGFTAMVDYAAAVVQDRSLATTYRQIHRAFADTVSRVLARLSADDDGKLKMIPTEGLQNFGMSRFLKSASWHGIYRDAGGTKLAKVASVNHRPVPAGAPAQRVADLDFEEILIGSQFGAIAETEQVHNVLGS